MPDDLTAHLAAHGIMVPVAGSIAPLSGRAGIVFFDHEPTIENKIVAELHLEKIGPEDPRFVAYAGKISEKPVSFWGVSGRPAILKLKGSAQLEYLYLIITETRSYLFAEYAYG